MTRSFRRTGFASIAIAVFCAAMFTINNNTAVAGDSLPTEKACASLENPDAALKGWCTSINRRKGNCLACHVVVTDKWPEALPPGGNIAPPLVAMKQRFPDRDKLRTQIWDPLSLNRYSVMPPFGKHKLLSEEEIDNIVEFLLTI